MFGSLRKPSPASITRREQYLRQHRRELPVQYSSASGITYLLLCIGMIGAVFQAAWMAIIIVPYDSPVFEVVRICSLLSYPLVFVGNLGAPVRRKVFIAVVVMFGMYWLVYLVHINNPVYFFGMNAIVITLTLLPNALVTGSLWKKKRVLAKVVTILLTIHIAAYWVLDAVFEIYFSHGMSDFIYALCSTAVMISASLARGVWVVWWACLSAQYTRYKE